MIQGIELQVISKILTCDDDSEVIDTLLAFSPDLYFSAYKSEIQYIHDQKMNYNLIPSLFDFQMRFPDFQVVVVTEPVEYLVLKLKEYRQYLILIETFNKVKDLQEGDVKDAWKYISMKAEQATQLEDSNPMDIVSESEERAEQIKEFSKQKRIPTGFDEIDKLMYGGLSTIEELLVIIARTNSGKAQPLNAPILTTSGWTTMGEIKVGDEVIGKDNDIGKVVELFPQGVKRYHHIEFDDGTVSECCKDHLWVVSNSIGSEALLEVIDTAEIKKRLKSKEDVYVPLTSPVECSTFASVSDRTNLLNVQIKKLINEGECSYVRDQATIHDIGSTTVVSLAKIARSLGMWVKCADRELTIDFKRRFKKIEKVSPAGKKKCQCILLDNESHTYLTNDFTVTHNTWVCTKMMESSQNNGFPVAYYSPEMQSAYLGTRFDTWRGHFENSQLIRGNYSDEYLKYLDLLKEQKTPAFVIEDKDFPDGVSVRTLDPFIKKNGIKLLIIDGISYMKDDLNSTRDQEKYKNIALGLFQLSKKYGCAVVLVMQANREVKNKDDKGESLPTLYNAEGSDQPARIATQAFGVRQIFDKHVLDIGLLKSRMANNTTPVFSYAWDINTGQVQYIPGDSSDGSGDVPAPTSPTLTTPTISFGTAGPDASTLSLLDDNSDDGDVEF